MDVQALVWLINMSSNPSVESIVIESTSALAAQVCEYFQARCRTIRTSLSHARKPLNVFSANQMYLCTKVKWTVLFEPPSALTALPICFWVQQPAKDCFSPYSLRRCSVFLLAFSKGDQELVLSNLIALDDDRTALRLQPIIWAHLLQRVLYSDSSPDKLEVMQMLFTEIPSFYWKADSVEIPFSLETLGTRISIAYDDGDVTLRVAINTTLYLYVAEKILHRHMLYEPTIFPQNNDEWYSRRRLLLSMAGSRSMRSMTGSHLRSMLNSHFIRRTAGPQVSRSTPASSFASNQSLFITIMESIGELVNIASLRKDNDDRFTVLEFLYKLIASVEFGDPLNPPRTNNCLDDVLSCSKFHILSPSIPRDRLVHAAIGH